MSSSATAITTAAALRYYRRCRRRCQQSQQQHDAEQNNTAIHHHQHHNLVDKQLQVVQQFYTFCSENYCFFASPIEMLKCFRFFASHNSFVYLQLRPHDEIVSFYSDSMETLFSYETFTLNRSFVVTIQYRDFESSSSSLSSSLLDTSLNLDLTSVRRRHVVKYAFCLRRLIDRFSTVKSEMKTFPLAALTVASSAAAPSTLRSVEPPPSSSDDDKASAATAIIVTDGIPKAIDYKELDYLQYALRNYAFVGQFVMTAAQVYKTKVGHLEYIAGDGETDLFRVKRDVYFGDRVHKIYDCYPN